MVRNIFSQASRWTVIYKSCLIDGAEILGYPGIIHGMYAKGGIELVQHFYMTSNNNLIDFLKARSAVISTESNNEFSRSLIRDAIQERLKMIIPFIDRWPEALALMSQPQNVPTALANLLTMVDDICYYAGDRSVNMSWYSRRVGLAGLYKVTELYMLQDTSEDFARTWNFLNRRMEEAEHLEGYFLQTENASQFAKQFASATFTTARNILGLRWNR
ncbi:ubiquinone biosynthesis protein COQ9, mitochondrial-like isoform X3 [Rhodnius prolixus]|uniref:ubiquinone biosynthesis protein COQ9, mitochondrial-like isoform X3 n=1 Tax=Rhodnius prolixus TaxID=13249 RepID=UPI003D18D32C